MDRIPDYDFENDRLLDKLLKEEPDFILPDDFADKLVKKINVQQAVKQNVFEFLTVLGVVLGILVAFGCTYYFLNKETFMSLKALLFTGYTPILAVFVLFIYFMDKVMLRVFNQMK